MLIPQLVLMALLIGLVYVVLRPQPPVLAVTYGAALYLIYSFGSRFLLLGHHRQGLMLTRDGQYAAAIEQFQASYRFFSAYPWLDRYRFLIMLTPAAQSYREMALINTAYCYAQLGDLDQTSAYYEQAIREFPESEMAKSHLELVKSVQSQVEPIDQE